MVTCFGIPKVLRFDSSNKGDPVEKLNHYIVSFMVIWISYYLTVSSCLGSWY